ncbi:MAG: organomercurial lyase [Microbacteriaceae bacterium]
MNRTEDVRLAIYRTFARTGREPDVAELADRFDLTEDEVREQYRALAADRHLALDDAGDIVLAHPFSTRNLGFTVASDETLWWGGCAWDSFAVPHLVPEASPSLVATTCPACGAPHAFVVHKDEPPRGTQVAHFLVPAAQIWDDVVHSCSTQRIFCDEQCVDDWLTVSGNDRGYVMSLQTLWQLASGWYAGRLDRGYVRRDPASAQDYLRSVGLRGAFWGLEG